MGSLPNLQALTDDPNAPYKHCLQGRDDSPRRSATPGNRPAVAAFNSQHCVDRYKVDRQYVEQRFAQFLREARLGLHHHPGGRRHRKVRQTRSTGSTNPYIVPSSWEEYLLELQLTSSPLSARSSRSNVQFAVNPGLIRRRDSLSSSQGASSVRRLISVVRSTPSRLGPVYSRRVLCRNFAALCLGHVTITAALLPLLSLQSSVSTWYWGDGDGRDGPGAVLLAASFTLASLASLISPYVINLLSCNWTLVIGYIAESLFFAAHLYPTLRWLVPSYVLLGICLGPLACARSTFVGTLAGKLTYVLTEEEELQDALYGDMKETLLWKLSRGLQLSHDVGMALGNVAAWLFLQYTWSFEEDDGRLSFMFEEERGELICGAHACPIPFLTPDSNPSNGSWIENAVIPCRTTGLLASVLVGCGLVSVALTAAFTNKIRLFMHQDPLERPAGIAHCHAIKCSFRDPRMQLAAPLSIFIGLQQGFIYSDFSKWYVVCALGVPYVNLVFVSMASLQAVAAFTLSLLMHNVPRTLVIAVGLVFHSCLLLVLMTWKPAGDDSAILYVIAAAWGVCNAIWETISFTMLLYVQSDTTWPASFAQSYFYRYLGMALAFLMHDLLCMNAKLYALAAALILAVCPLAWLEFKMGGRRKLGASRI